MRYAYFSFILIILIMLSFCVGCSTPQTPNKTLHNIHATAPSRNKEEKNKAMHEKNQLLQQKKYLINNIHNINFD